MNRFFRTSILSAAVAAMTLAAIPAEAGDRWRHHRHHDRGDAIAAGVIGLAAGAFIGSVLSQPRPVYRHHYVSPPAPTYYRNYRAAEPEVIYYDSYEPWTRGWYRACDARYRTFDPDSGTFMGYDGQRHFCTLN